MKKQMYASTERLGENTWEWLLTEKLDGSNLCLFRQCDLLLVAARNKVLPLEEALDGIGYRGLAPWLREHGEELRESICDGSAICGEWLGMGVVKYPGSFPPFNMFAKARLEGSMFEPTRLGSFDYDPDRFGFAFMSESVPDFVGTVPVIARVREAPTVELLDRVYDEYTERVGRPVEGIVVTQKEVPDRRCKYVRMKRGKIGPHVTKEARERMASSRSGAGGAGPS